MRRRVTSVAALVLVALASLPAQTPTQRAASFPAALTDAQFWSMVSGFTEPGGTFHSDNFTSNEVGFVTVMSLIDANGPHGGAYLGVGPEQNFNYILAIKPKIAFIIDIRRQAVMQHLLYKAIFELSADRAEFISRLFSLPKPKTVTAAMPIDALWQAFAGVTADAALFDRNKAEVTSRLTKTHGMALSTEDLESLEYVYEAFFKLGTGINYGGYEQQLSTSNTSFAKLAASVDASGAARSFLGTAASFDTIKTMHARNLIVPVQGDFGGPKTIRTIGDYVRAQGGVVSAFYISNVEQYLYDASGRLGDLNGGAKRFYDNLATLPIDASSVLLRVPLGALPADANPAARGRLLALCPMGDFLGRVKDGLIRTEANAKACGL